MPERNTSVPGGKRYLSDAGNDRFPLTPPGSVAIDLHPRSTYHVTNHDWTKHFALRIVEKPGGVMFRGFR